MTDVPVLPPPKTLRRRNRELAPLGLRICRTHGGAALPLTDDNFYVVNRRRGQFDTECKACCIARATGNKARRQQSDPNFQEHQRRIKARCYRKHHAKWLDYRGRYRLELKRKRTAEIIRGAVV